MELADAGSLDSRIEREKRVPELDVLDAGIKVASALASALKKNLLHRDIKPGNILFNEEGEPKLIDFGLARKAEGNHDEETTIWGTPYYIAPEKVKREREDFLSDMYSLAGTLYHAITGSVPFEAPTVEAVVAAHIHTPLTAPNQVVPEISAPTSDGLVRAMAKNPGERFQSYDEFIMALEAARSQLLVSQLRSQPATQPIGRRDASRAACAKLVAPIIQFWRRNSAKPSRLSVLIKSTPAALSIFHVSGLSLVAQNRIALPSLCARCTAVSNACRSSAERLPVLLDGNRSAKLSLTSGINESGKSFPRSVKRPSNAAKRALCPSNCPPGLFPLKTTVTALVSIRAPSNRVSIDENLLNTGSNAPYVCSASDLISIKSVNTGPFG
jgi:serine/threonine protein kinase